MEIAFPTSENFSHTILGIWTDLSRNLDEEGMERIKKTSKFWKNHDQGSATSLVAAFDPALQRRFSPLSRSP
jgi:hypothetical protein